MSLFLMVLLAMSATVQALMGFPLGAAIDASLACLVLVTMIMNEWE